MISYGVFVLYFRPRSFLEDPPREKLTEKQIKTKLPIMTDVSFSVYTSLIEMMVFDFNNTEN